MDISASQSSCLLYESNPVPFASNAIELSTQLLSPDSLR
ncbi:unnamed protein product [Schistosoma margrebowiei]|uniref:Uncharacterized protein n=1 Tax=Schistosoma margrebowiei TaxID=48269 RepID=A0A3P7XAF3_9TREM|nr:unnamed protein product [Schistosoma margrebowiei]